MSRYRRAVPGAYFSSMVFASLLGTYLDLLFVGGGWYAFPRRLFPEFFTINVVFTLVALPLLTGVLLYCCRRMSPVSRWALFVVVSFSGPLVEMISERLGFFWHSDQWKHAYSMIGYVLFFIMVWHVFKWMDGGRQDI